MSETAKITSKNQITLPVMRRSLGVRTGDKVDFIRNAAGNFERRARNEVLADVSDHLIGTINKQNGCRTTLTFGKAAAQSPHFSELQR